MPQTLADLSRIETDTLRKSIMDTLLMNVSFLELISWETLGTLSTTIISYKDLPSVGFRKINEGYAESTGNFESKVENIALMGGMIDTDKAIARAKNTIADARVVQQNMMLKALSYKFNDKFINGNPLTDVEEFKGVEARVDDLYADGYTGQKFAGGNTTTVLTASEAAMNTFLDDLDKLIYAIDGHQPDFLFMNQHMLLMLRSILRRRQLLDTTRDMFDRRVDTYQGARLIDTGVKADQSTLIQAWENATGTDASDDYASILAVKLGEGEHLWGIQEYPLEVTDKGLLEAKPVYRTEIDWPLGLAHVSPRSLARLYGLRLKS